MELMYNMERKWTEQQKAAIEGKGSILVSARAGTGKTAVLSEKIAKNVLNDTDISNILVMTFSAAAANEMKDRIKKRLELFLLINKSNSGESFWKEGCGEKNLFSKRFSLHIQLL